MCFTLLKILIIKYIMILDPSTIVYIIIIYMNLLSIADFLSIWWWPQPGEILMRWAVPPTRARGGNGNVPLLEVRVYHLDLPLWNELQWPVIQPRKSKCRLLKYVTVNIERTDDDLLEPEHMIGELLFQGPFLVQHEGWKWVSTTFLIFASVPPRRIILRPV